MNYAFSLKELQSNLMALKKRVEEWRQTRTKDGNGRIPEELWVAAVDVAREEGVFRTARALRINYKTLRKRASEDEAAADKGLRAPAFIELRAGELSVGRTVIELHGSKGGRMRIDASGTDCSEAEAAYRYASCVTMAKDSGYAKSAFRVGDFDTGLLKSKAQCIGDSSRMSFRSYFKVVIRAQRERRRFGGRSHHLCSRHEGFIFTLAF